MNHLACCLVLAGAVAACTSDPDVAAIDGTWALSRTVSTQAAAPCREMTASTDTLEISLGAAPPFTLPEHAQFDPQGYDHAVTETSISFVAEEYGLFGTDPSRPVLIQHALQLDGDTLAGTASAQGDGDDLGCRWELTVTGTRAP